MKLTKSVVSFFILTLCWMGQLVLLQAQDGTSSVQVKTTNPDGQYNTSEKIHLVSYSNKWLKSPSSMKVRLNTGDTITVAFKVDGPEDMLLPFGVPGKNNIEVNEGVAGSTYNRGVNRFVELKHGKNKGKYLIAGAFVDYEGNGKADYMLITDENGKITNTFSFNHYVFWAIELSDGSIVAGGEFNDYGGNTDYDKLIKFTPDFKVDAEWMTNLQKDGVLNNYVGSLASNNRIDEGAGMSDHAIVEDPDYPGAIYVSGAFENNNEIGRGLFRIYPNGKVDANFKPKADVYGNTFTTSGKDYNGGPLAIDGDYIWCAGSIWANNRNDETYLYKLNKQSGDPAPGYTAPTFESDEWSAPMGILVMPEKAEATDSPGGVLLLARSGTTKSGFKVTTNSGSRTSTDRNVISFQDDGSLTPSEDFNVQGAFNGTYGVDGSAILKNKLWLAYHPESDNNPTVSITQGVGDNAITAEGCLVVLDLNGSFSVMNETWSIPNNGSDKDGFSQGKWDGMTLSTSEEGNLLLGGNFTSVAGVADNDYHGLVVLSFQRCMADYEISEDDLTPHLKVLEVLDYNITDMFGSTEKFDNLPIDPDFLFEDNYGIAVNMPYTPINGSFVTQWQVEAGDEIKIPIVTDKKDDYNYYVDWGDGNKGEANVQHYEGIEATHTYAKAGTYDVSIYCGVDSNNDEKADGTGFPQISFNNADKLIAVKQWGHMKWKNMSNAFKSCKNLQITATDSPNLQGCTSLQNIFNGAVIVNFDISGWDVSKITDMSGMFSGATAFNNGDKSLNWESKTAAVTSMANMFQNATAFNQDISGWDVSKVTDMSGMFTGASAFNQNISPWNISSLTDATNMLKGVSLSIENYDALLATWWAQVKQGTANKNVPFHGGSSQWCGGEVSRQLLIDNGWGDGTAKGSYDNTDDSGIIDGGSSCADFFITEWKIPSHDHKIKIKREEGHGGPMDIFWGDGAVDYAVTGEPEHVYSEDISQDDTITIKMRGEVSMYYNTGNHSGENNLTKVVQFGNIKWKSMEFMFGYCRNMVFAEDIDIPDLTYVKSIHGIFSNCDKFNSPSISRWDVSNVTNIRGAFSYTTAFNQPLNEWDVSNVTLFGWSFRNTTAFNQPLNEWDVSSAEEMWNMFHSATAFNQPLDKWDVSKVTDMRGMFHSGGDPNSYPFPKEIPFDQDLSAWKINGLIRANEMFSYTKLSSANYDALLISWAEQLKNGGAKKNVKFHGGNSTYCTGADARKYLIDNGWGDGTAGATAAAYQDIVDGGSAALDISNLMVYSNPIGQKENGFIEMGNTEPGVNYYVREKGTTGEAKMGEGLASGILKIDMGPLTTTTEFDVWALKSGEVCEAIYKEKEVIIEVHQKIDLEKSYVSLKETSPQVVGSSYTMELHIVDMLGNVVEPKNLHNTSHITSPEGVSIIANAEQLGSYKATSTVAGTYQTTFSVYTAIPNESETASRYDGGELNIVEYTFNADKVTGVKVETITPGATQIPANDNEYYEFKVSATDQHENPVQDVKISFRATPDVRFSYLDADGKEQHIAVDLAVTDIPTLADGTLTVRARSKKAWTDFETNVSYYDESTSSSKTCTGSPVKYSYVAGKTNTQTSSIVVDPEIQEVGKDITLTITLKDEYGNPCRGRATIFRKAKNVADDKLASDVTYDGLANDRIEKTSDEDGKSSIAVSSKKVGAFKTEGSTMLNGIELTNGVSIEYMFKATKTSAEMSSLELISDKATADGTDANTIKVIVKDTYGNLVPGANVKVFADEKIDWGSGLNTDYVDQSLFNGEVSLRGSSTSAGDYTTPVYVETTSGYTAIASGEGTAKNPVSHSFLASSPIADKCTIEVQGSPAVAGTEKVSLLVTVKDENNNVVPDAVVRFFKTGDVTASAGTYGAVISGDPDSDWDVKTNTSGQASLNLSSKIALNFSTRVALVTEESVLFIGTATYTFIEGGVNASTSKVSMYINGSDVTQTNEMDIYLYDAYGNAIPKLEEDVEISFAATPEISFDDNTAGDAYTCKFSKGDFGFKTIILKSDKPGDYSTEVKMGNTQLLGSPISYNFVAGAPDLEKSTYEIIGNGSLSKGASVGGWFEDGNKVPEGEKVTIKVTLRDTKNNPVVGMNVGVSNAYKTEGFLDFGFGNTEFGKAVTNESGEAFIYAVSTKIGRVDAQVGFNVKNEWDPAGFTMLTSDAEPASFYFVDKYTTVDEAQNMAVRAKWYVLKTTDAKKHTEVLAKQKAGLETWYLSGTNSPATLSLSTLDNIKTGVVGPYELVLTATNPNDASNKLERKGVVVSVVDAKTSYDENLELAIRAEDYALSAADAQAHDAAATKAKSHLQAWSLSDWSKKDLASSTTPNETQLASIKTGTAGTYPLTFTQGTLNKTINVKVFADESWFITTWKVVAGEEILIPVPDVSGNGAGYDFHISWGDGSDIEHLTSFPYKHTYADAGTYTIKITGIFPAICFGAVDLEGSELPEKLMTIEQWGTIEWTYMGYAFTGCQNLTISEYAGKPNLAKVESMEKMFALASKVNSPTISTWDVSNVNNFAGVFKSATAFNQSLNNWNVNKSTNMLEMFYGAKAFNQNLNSWDVSKVTNMSHMFENAEAFDQSLEDWKIKILTNAEHLFKGAELSVANYDATLISWNGQVEAGDAKQNVKFHGGLSEYCEGESARASLIENGWGDGLEGGGMGSADETGIIDGGSGRPMDNYEFLESDVSTCVGTDAVLTLDGSEANVAYQLYDIATGNAVGDPVNGLESMGEIEFVITAPAATATYGIKAEHTDFACDAVLTTEATVTVDAQTQGGTLGVKDNADANLCLGVDELVLELNDYVGDIVRWESSENGTFSDLKIIRNAMSSNTVSRLLRPTSFRVVVESGACGTEYSKVVRVTVDPTSVGGEITPSATTVCAGSGTTLTLSGHVGTIVWQRYDDATSDWVMATGSDNTANFTVSATDLVNEGTSQLSYKFRAQLTSGECSAATSNVVTILVDPTSVGGEITPSATTVCAGSGTTLTLSGHVGTIVWEVSKDDGATWSAVTATETSTTANFTVSAADLVNEGTSQFSYKFRAQLTSGECSAATSNEVTILVDPTSVGGIASTVEKICNNTTTSITLNDYVGNILRWEVSTDDGASWATASPDGAGEDVYTTANLKNDSRKDAVYQFRALVQSGECNSAESTISAVTVLPKVVAVNYYATISDGKPITIPVLDSIKYSPVTLDRIGTPDQGGTAKLNADKTVSYSAKSGFVGEEKFKYYLTVDGQCQDSAYIVVTTNCLPHSMSDLTMEVCVDATHDINLVSYMPYAGLEEVSVWAEDGSLIDDATSYSSDNLKVDNTTVFTYYYEKAGFCVGSESANIYINAVSNDRTAIFGDKTISVCGASLKDGGYKLNSLIPYASNGGAWDKELATTTSATVSLEPYLNKDAEDGWVFDAQGFWSKVIEMNSGAVPDSVSVTIPYSADDACVGKRGITLTIEITKD
ncbi:MAG: BspA family leucine-rich repeat surface protein [Bacteroidales bacterium]